MSEGGKDREERVFPGVGEEIESTLNSGGIDDIVDILRAGGIERFYDRFNRNGERLYVDDRRIDTDDLYHAIAAGFILGGVAFLGYNAYQQIKILGAVVVTPDFVGGVIGIGSMVGLLFGALAYANRWFSGSDFKRGVKRAEEEFVARADSPKRIAVFQAGGLVNPEAAGVTVGFPDGTEKIFFYTLLDQIPPEAIRTARSQLEEIGYTVVVNVDSLQ